MALAARGPASYADLLRAPEDRIAEILDGELHTSPRPGAPHSACAFVLSTELGPPFQFGRGGPGGWLFLFEPELHLAADVLVPDLAGWRRERLPKPPEAPAVAVAPDWVCEILSPSTERIDRARKLPAYARHGVAHAWLVNPASQTLEVLRSEGQRWVLIETFGGDGAVRAEPFQAIELDLPSLWGETPAAK